MLKRFIMLLAITVVITLVAPPIWSQAPGQAPGTWEPAADLQQGRAGHTATLLANGKVLIAGGKDASRHALATAGLFDPATGFYTPVSAHLPAPVWGHTATLLKDAGALNVARTQASAALLPDGTVLVAGGQDTLSQDRDSAAVYDPFTDIFTSLSSLMTTVRSAHLGLALLYSGQVLIAGGTSARQLVETAEVFARIQGTFQAIESPGTAPGLFGATV